jgi:UDP-N-acetylmuramoyl-L-alanyl-D-glutamate--2,6-diaminopimelate ligase
MKIQPIFNRRFISASAKIRSVTLQLIELMGPDGSGDGARMVGPDRTIAGLASDSRDVQPGYLFAALAGAKTDGRRYIDDALARGAVAILAGPDAEDLPAPTARTVTLLRDPLPRRRLARMAARFFGPQPDVVAAVTGTNGKTSVAHFTAQLWQALGRPAASLGTLGLKAPGFEVAIAHTSPDPITLHRLLAELRKRGIDRVAIEASSHGLDQHRLDGLSIKAAAFTNLSRDHLDYHATLDSYFAAKMRLFDAIMPPGGVAVVNADSDWFDAVAGICKSRGHRLISYGYKGRELKLLKVETTAGGISVAAEIFGAPATVELKLVGDFQAANALCALGLVVACGEDAAKAFTALGKIEGVPGRMQAVATRRNGAAVFVDYAHTPDALATVLSALQSCTRARLHVLFGCGGDRDAGKRPMMGEIAASLADRIYVTDDNPRSENPAAIRRAILAACPGAIEIGDRGQAIGFAVGELEPGDTLLLAGKGHEQGQIVGADTRPFDDASCARQAAAAADAPVDADIAPPSEAPR